MSHPDNIIKASIGCIETHVSVVSDHIQLHSDVITPWRQLVNIAKQAGFELTLASGYRSFERQQAIWNAKLAGERPVLDDNGHELDLSGLEPLQRVERVLRWSALPGASRHHWGTDMDIYDRAAVSGNYQLQLVPAEYMDGGPFAPMIAWLQDYVQRPGALEFFFPYTEDKNGVIPEPWHLSYRPVAEQFQQNWSLDHLGKHLRNCDVLEKDTVLEHIDRLYERFIVSSISPDFINPNSIKV